MSELILADSLLNRLVQIFREMEEVYDEVADRLGFSCTGCPDNCCDSYFEHHTYAEWCYLWLGFKRLDTDRQQEVLHRAQAVQAAYDEALERGQRPQVMCPLNEEGLCILYPYRLLVCRTHGVPAAMTRPDGKRLEFPGCFRCQELVKSSYPGKEEVPRMERTPLFMQLASLENELLADKRHIYPKMKMTIARMLLQGPPTVPTPCCER